MPDFDTSTFRRSSAGQLLKRLAQLDASGAPQAPGGVSPRDLSAVVELERLGLVKLVRGEGALAWMIRSVELTDAGRARATEVTDS